MYCPLPAMSGIPTGGAPAPVKTREEMLQEWREQRAAKLATQTSNGKALASSQASFSRMPPGSGAPGKENWPAPGQAGKVAAREGADGFSSLAARLESLKRESLRPSIAPTSSAPSQAGVQFEPAGQVDTTVLRRLATQLFEDESWKQLYEKGMNAQLTRSKDGATEGTKIKELAGRWEGVGGLVCEWKGWSCSHQGWCGCHFFDYCRNNRSDSMFGTCFLC